MRRSFCAISDCIFTDICYDIDRLIQRTVIATADGETYSYMFNQESAVIALLCFADEVARQEEGEFYWSITRTKPLLQSTVG